MLRPSRIALIHAALLLFAVALVLRAADVQLVQAATWRARAQRQHFAAAVIPAPRGDIYDVQNVPVAMSREMVRVSIAPRELRNRAALAGALARLGVARQWITRATDANRAWVTLPGSYLAGDAATLTAMRGVYATPVIQRVYSSRQAMRRVVGWVDASNAPMGGLELALDSLLRGRDGRAMVSRDSRGHRFESPGDSDVAPVRGDAVVLTINQELQEISEQALDDAVTRTGADGGDIVILDPKDGEIRAMASERQGVNSFGNPVVSEPFEPGSTLKPLVASQLLMDRLATPTDVVNTENGTFRLDGRTITDEHKAARMSLADVIRFSSNIGIVKFSSRFTTAQEYQTLRDFGFGTPTGVAIPGEASGTLRPPKEWSSQSAASLVMGYEIAVTPLQLVAAYAAVANGGLLLQPAIIREIRAPDGSVIFHHERRVVRRLMTPDVAAEVRRMMMGVVEEGTGKEAALGQYTLAGKTGTARRTGPDGRYEAGAYTASFVGLFPADDPQYVIYVKMDRPRNSIFGAMAAAPVSKIVLQAAIAARNAALDRRELTTHESPPGSMDSIGKSVAIAPAADSGTGDAADSESVSVLLSLPVPRSAARPASARVVPDVHGLTLRAAVRALHAAGFQVQPDGFGMASGTMPQAGTTAPSGTLVRLATTP
jgi:cell division protein FtsI (penicillin-binding protein 3)